jgi:hypothetical protein
MITWDHCEESTLKDQTQKQLREALKAILELMYADSKDLRAAALRVGLPFETARQARDYGKGSVTTINGLILNGLGIAPQDIQKHLPKIRKMFNKTGELTSVERLIEEALSKYGQNELIAWLRLLLARYEIEKDLGIRKKAGRPPKKKI